MGELGEEYRELKEMRQEKRWKNYEQCKQLLIKYKIDFQEFANGHFHVGEYDFWATTGLFINRKTKQKGRGILALIRRLTK
jgi:hypothetical protein